MYESVSMLNYEAVEKVTYEYMAQLHENRLRVTQGNPEGNLSRVTIENSSSIDNNYNNNNIRVTQNMKEKGGCNCVCVSAVESNFSDDLTHAKTEVTLSGENQGYPQDKTSQLITEAWVTYEGLPGVRVGYPQPKNDIDSIENKGYPSTDNDLVSGSEFEENKMHLLPLLHKALVKLAKDEYHSIVPDMDEFTRAFNKRDPEYRKSLGQMAIENEARILKMRGWE
jgi:hypothetical protein